MRPGAVVVDASALVLAFAKATPGGLQARSTLRGRRRHAPHLVDAEVGHVLRRLALRGELSEEAAGDARRLAVEAVDRRHTHLALGERAWQLRHNLTFYDALYVALAEKLHHPLMTADARLAAANGPRCAFEVLA